MDWIPAPGLLPAGAGFAGMTVKNKSFATLRMTPMGRAALMSFPDYFLIKGQVLFASER